MPRVTLKGSQVSAMQLRDQEGEFEVLSVSKDRMIYAAEYLDDADEKEDVKVYKRVQEPKIEFIGLKVGQKFEDKIVSMALF
eukprot:1617992-Heterocapsa_arctica.AAC.1